MNLPNNVLVQIAQQYANGDSQAASVTSLFAQDNTSKQSEETGLNRYSITEESWKHHAQARAILGNLIGPNGEQLTSTDPYNTTVFVGGLSPLISEETLRTFFVPFGDIHYVRPGERNAPSRGDDSGTSYANFTEIYITGIPR